MTYFIKNKKFEEMYKCIEEAYNMCHVLRNYCETSIYSEDICYIKPIIKHVYKDLDYTYADFINIKY